MRAFYETPVRVNHVNTTWRDGLRCVLIQSVPELFEALKSVRGKSFAVDTETTGLDFDTLELVGFSFCADDKVAYYVPVGHRFGKNLPLVEAVENLTAAMMYRPELPKLFYNKLYDLRVLGKYGVPVSRLTEMRRRQRGLPGRHVINSFDVMALVWNTDCNVPLPSLKDSVKRLLGIDAPTYAQVAGQSTLQNMEPEQVTEYAACDALFTWLLAKSLNPFYQKHKNIVDLDNNFLEPLMEIMDTPLPIDKQLAEQDAAEIKLRLQQIQQRVHVIVGRPFNLGSGEQLGRALEELGIDTGERTEKKGIMMTGIDELERVRDRNPELISLLVEYKELSKKLNSFVETFIADYRDDLKGFRVQYQALKVPTGRLASGVGQKDRGGYYAGINVQAIESPVPMMYDAVYAPGKPGTVLGWEFVPHPPRRDGPDDKGGAVESADPHWNVRNYVRAPDGYLIVSIDYSAQELVVLANLSGDPAFVGPLSAGDDLHKETAVNMWGKDKYNKALRKLAKNLNFSNIYLGTPFSLHRVVVKEDPSITIGECEDSYEKWWNLHGADVEWEEDRLGRRWPHLVARSGLAAYHAKLFAGARRNGYFKTLLGRIRRTGYWYNSPSRKDQSFGDRTCANGPVQGGCGDIMRWGYTQIHKNIMLRPEWGGSELVKYMMPVHDEDNFLVTDSEPYFTQITNAIAGQMTDLGFLGFKVPLQVNISVGKRWGSLFPFTYKDGRWEPKGL